MYWPLLSLALLVPGPTAGVGKQVSYSFRLDEVRPGCSEDGVGYPVTVVVRVAVRNRSDRPLIFCREFSAAPYYRMAASGDMAAFGNYETRGGDLEVQAAGVPEPAFGSTPDVERFIVVQPGGTFEAAVRTGFLAGNMRALEQLAPGRAGGFVFPGRHAVQVTVRTWPYVFAKRDTVERLKSRWRYVGDLVAEDVKTPFLPFELPEGMMRCDGR